MAVNLLMSYAYHAGTDLADIRSRMPCGRIMIDSGAFTAFTTGKVIKFDEYADYLKNSAGLWDHAVTLDTIGDPVATAKNTTKLHRMGIPVMPVFTVGGKLPEFDAMVRDVGYVCVGGTVGMDKEQQIRRLAMLQRRAQDLGGGTHALGVGSESALRRIRPYSSDASSLTYLMRFGMVFYWDGKKVTYVTATSRHTKNPNHARDLAKHGVNVSTLFDGKKISREVPPEQIIGKLSYAYAIVDEVLRAEKKVPVPTGINDDPGTHLYNSMAGKGLAEAVADLDGQVHSGKHAHVWSPYHPKHTRNHCRMKETS